MSGNIDQVEATNMLKGSLGLGGGYVATTGPVKGRLMTANGTATSNGTEVTNSGTSTYAAQDVGTALGTPAAGAVTNSAAITWTNLPAATIVGLEIWDQNATPKRKWFGGLAANKTVALGDSLTLAAGALNIGLS